jgi:hypothetical protein
MLGQSHFYHETIRRTVVAFGSVFNDIHVRRPDASGTVLQSMRVPLAYGPKAKFLARLYEDPTGNSPIQLTLPRMGFEITGFQYDSQRKVNKLNVLKKVDDTVTNGLKKQFFSVPYNINFSLFVMAKNQEDALQVVEQIIPFFTPAFTLTINAVPEMGIKDDFPLIMESLTYEDDYEGDFATRRSIIYTLSFTTKVNFYGPVYEQGVIKKVKIDNYLDAPTSTLVNTRYEAEPNPTSSEADDDFGFSETWTDTPST